MSKMLKTKAYEKWLQEQAQIIIRYRQVEKSAILAEYHSLKQLVESKDFQAKKTLLTTTRYADTQEAKTMAAYKNIKTKPVVLLYRIINKQAWKEKALVAEYLSLQEQILAPDFQQAHTFWKNPKRWLTTPEHQQELRYKQVCKHEDIVFFHQHKELEIAALESYKMVWAEEFETSQISSNWQTGFLYPAKELKPNHSHVAECQAYTQGRNTQVANRSLTITTKKQKTMAPAWHPTKGMILHPFTFTSDVWHTPQAIAPATGVLQAKVRCSGKAKHILCLTTPGAKLSLHILPANKTINKEVIYTLVWNKKEVINYINNMEVARSKNPLSDKAFHLLMRSYVPAKAGKGQLSIDWIRIYTNA